MVKEQFSYKGVGDRSLAGHDVWSKVWKSSSKATVSQSKETSQAPTAETPLQLHSTEPLDTTLEELFTRTIPGEMLPLEFLINTVEGYKNRNVTLLLLHHPCLAEMTEVRILKVSCHTLIPS